MQLTLNIDMTPENLEKLKVFCEDTKAVPDKKPAAKTKASKTDSTKTGVTEQESATEESKTSETKNITLTDVRAVALKLSKAGKSDLLKEIFAKFGAAKLSEVPEDKYVDLMEELTNA